VYYLAEPLILCVEALGDEKMVQLPTGIKEGRRKVIQHFTDLLVHEEIPSSNIVIIYVTRVTARR
jgi:hypothetical protein